MPERQNGYIPPASEREKKQELLSFVDGEYKRSVASLNKTGIVSLLPESETLGVLGIDGKEYPMPTHKEVQDLFSKNAKLVTLKRSQGFTRLQLTPFALPLQVFTDRTTEVLKKHAQEGKLFQTKHAPSDPDILLELDGNDSVHWEDYRNIMSDVTGRFIYFPKHIPAYQGSTKTEVIKRPDICAVPGWSISLIETDPLQAKRGEGKILAGRKQLEHGKAPSAYLEKLQTDNQYHKETGWAPEDFLINFVTRLTETNQISNSYDGDNATIFLGMCIREGSLLSGYWSEDYKQIALEGYSDINGFYDRWGVHSAVRLDAVK